jgi:hypothetical protein
MQKHYSSPSARVLRFAAGFGVFGRNKKAGVLVGSESRLHAFLSVWKNKQ